MIIDPFEELYETFDKNRIMNYFCSLILNDKYSYNVCVEYTLDYFNELKTTL